MPAVALGAGLHLGCLDRTQPEFRFFRAIKTVTGITGLVIATLLVGSFVLRGPGVVWQPFSDQLFSEAKRLKKPVIIDIYADWCAPCRELDNLTFHHPGIDPAKIMKFSFSLHLQFNANTRNANSSIGV